MLIEIENMKKFKKLVLYDQKSEPLEAEFLDELRGFAESINVVFAEKEYAHGLKLQDLTGADALVARLLDNFDDSLFEKSGLTTHSNR